MDDIQNLLLSTWFNEPVKSHWFSSTAEIDDMLREQFLSSWDKAMNGELDDWAKSANGILALIILLDQVPLNIFRGMAKSFSSESLAIAFSHRAINSGMDLQVPVEKRAFIYMPLMHSEDIDDQDLAVASFKKAGLINNQRFAEHHRNIIKRFGRFPHRNELLKRDNTKEEVAYLNSAEAFTG